MPTIEYNGFIVRQDPGNHHVAIFKDGNMVFHSHCSEEKSEQELRETVDFYIQFSAMLED